MADQRLRFYLDEHMPVVIARELRRRGIDTVTVRDLELRGDSDENHLSHANAMGRVLCTMDDDFMKLATAGVEHAGIVIGTRKDRKYDRYLGAISPMGARHLYGDEMRNHIEYLKDV